MVLDDLAVYLQGLALVTPGTDLFIGKMPGRPVECCALYEYGGDQPLRNQSEGAARSGAQSGERPRIQLLCRSETYSAGRTFIQGLWQALDGVCNQTINGTFYVRIVAQQSPFLLERDDSGRCVFGANFAVTKAV